jgi:predicted RNA-binding Zn ribbon-like protein
MTQSETERPPFKLLGGWPCLDFVNTVNWDKQDGAAERFFEYADLVQWNQFTQNLTGEETAALLQEADQYPERAATVFAQAMRLRAALHRLFTAVAAGQSPAPKDVDILNDVLAEAMANARLMPTGNYFAWGWREQTISPNRVLWPVARSAAELLTSDKLERVGKCAGDSCGWLFLDTSRNHSRRWCEMKHCGNQAKARRHYRQKRTVIADN